MGISDKWNSDCLSRDDHTQKGDENLWRRDEKSPWRPWQWKFSRGFFLSAGPLRVHSPATQSHDWYVKFIHQMAPLDNIIGRVTVLYSFVWTSGTPHLFLRGLHIYDPIFDCNWLRTSSIKLFMGTELVLAVLAVAYCTENKSLIIRALNSVNSGAYSRKRFLHLPPVSVLLRWGPTLTKPIHTRTSTLCSPLLPCRLCSTWLQNQSESRPSRGLKSKLNLPFSGPYITWSRRSFQTSNSSISGHKTGHPIYIPPNPKAKTQILLCERSPGFFPILLGCRVSILIFQDISR